MGSVCIVNWEYRQWNSVCESGQKYVYEMILVVYVWQQCIDEVSGSSVL